MAEEQRQGPIQNRLQAGFLFLLHALFAPRHGAGAQTGESRDNPRVETTHAMRWKPSVTVAAVIEAGGRFLLVEESTRDGLRLNNPAGHLEPGETLPQAVMREVLEETAYDFTPEALVGMYLTRFCRTDTEEDVTYLRFAFAGQLGQRHRRALDQGILGCVWMTYGELAASRARHRNGLVMQCIDDYRAGQRFSLQALHADASIWGAVRPPMQKKQAEELPGRRPAGNG